MIGILNLPDGTKMVCVVSRAKYGLSIRKAKSQRIPKTNVMTLTDESKHVMQNPEIIERLNNGNKVYF